MNKPKVFFSSFRDAFRLLPRVFSDAWLVLLAIHFGRSISSELFSYAAQMIQAKGREDLAGLGLTIGLQFIFEMAWSTIWAFVAIRVTRENMMGPTGVHRSPLKDFEHLLIEGIRVMAAILWRMPLLIVPALVEIVRLSFVPHVVLLDPSYERGETDALTKSRSVVRGRFIALGLTWILFFVVSSAPALTHGSMSEWFWERPLGFVLESLLTLFINLTFEIFLVALFLRISMIGSFAAKDAVGQD
ncbi:MAG TPA: hypothetical protein VM432_05115 [Bdellovibrionales bacterium]|nr:hypothetical protein [Bdellovibrionales bacterium]